MIVSPEFPEQRSGNHFLRASEWNFLIALPGDRQLTFSGGWDHLSPEKVVPTLVIGVSEISDEMTLGDFSRGFYWTVNYLSRHKKFTVQ
jgi:hypothetical protein